MHREALGSFPWGVHDRSFLNSSGQYFGAVVGAVRELAAYCQNHASFLRRPLEKAIHPRGIERVNSFHMQRQAH
jgi:hypothetical protein